MKQKITSFSFTFVFLVGLLLSGSLMAQDKPPADKPPAKELTDAEKARANNPLANTKGFNVQYYYRPNLNETTGGMANTTWLRAIYPTGRILWRVSAPLEVRTVNNETTNYSKSGFGDLDIMAAYLAVMTPKVTFGVGPNITFNTASDPALGTGKNSLGVAAILFVVPSKQFQTGGLVIYKKDVWGDDDRAPVNQLAFQPFLIWQLGNGFYFRSVPIIPFNLANGNYHVPVGLGLGKVIKIKNTVFNFFVEPQPSLLVHGQGEPLFQVYAALNIQF